MIAYLPARWEFGWLCMCHAPQVNADPREKIVFAEPGLEALYPSASMVVEVRSMEDRAKRSAGDALRDELRAKWPRVTWVEPDKSAERKPFSPKPFRPCPRMPFAPIVICPRRRAYGMSKNWQGWPEVAEQLHIAGRSPIACGAPGLSDKAVEPFCVAATWRPKWSSGYALDATITAMRQASLVIATDAGLAHLAVMIGVPLLLVSYGKDCRTAPGLCRTAQEDAAGMDGAPYIPIQVDRYEAANHTGCQIEVMPDVWDKPMAVARRALEIVG